MQCIKRLCLSLRYGGDILGPRKGLKASETPSRILNQNPRRCRVCRGLVIEQRPDVVWKLGISKSGSRQLTENDIRLLPGFTHPSNGQPSTRVWIRSGLVDASSLYTLQLLASRLRPPSAATPRARRATISPASVWNTCLSVV